MIKKDKESLEFLINILKYIEIKVTEANNILSDEIFHAVCLNLKAIFQLLKIDSADKSSFTQDFTNTHPQICWKEARKIRNGLVHGYFLYDWQDVLDFCQKYLPILLNQAQSIFNNKSLPTAPPINQFTLIQKIQAYALEKNKRTTTEYGRDLFRYGNLANSLAENQKSKLSVDKKYAIQNCIEIYGEACHNLYNFDIKPKDDMAKKFIDATNQSSNVSTIIAYRMRSISAHELETLDEGMLINFSNDFLLIKDEIESIVVLMDFTEGKISKEEYHNFLGEKFNKKFGKNLATTSSASYTEPAASSLSQETTVPSLIPKNHQLPINLTKTTTTPNKISHTSLEASKPKTVSSSSSETTATITTTTTNPEKRDPIKFSIINKKRPLAPSVGKSLSLNFEKQEKAEVASHNKTNTITHEQSSDDEETAISSDITLSKRKKLQ